MPRPKRSEMPSWERYIDRRLKAWGRWLHGQDQTGVGFDSQSVIFKMMKLKGRATVRAIRDCQAEERIDATVVFLGTLRPTLAHTLRAWYYFDPLEGPPRYELRHARMESLIGRPFQRRWFYSRLSEARTLVHGFLWAYLAEDDLELREMGRLTQE
ncbi:MAG: hypothetical protein AAF358_13610 [Pseudomonadota bacterium]